MRIYSALCISLLLSACSQIIDPKLPEEPVPTQDVSTPSVDMTTSPSDMSQELDQAVMIQDMGTSIDMMNASDASTLDAMVSPSRSCSNWNECYLGESCDVVDGSGTCGPTANAQICAEGNAQAGVVGTRTYDGECCVPDDPETRGACVFPYTIVFDTQEDNESLEAPGTLNAQFSGGECVAPVAQYPRQIDLVLTSEIPDDVARTLCVVIELPRTENYDFVLYDLASCCEQTQTFEEASCGFTFGTSETDHKRRLNVPYDGMGKIIFGLRLGAASDDATTMILARELQLYYKVHGGPCCNESHLCPEGFSCEEGLCE